jgi:hypothetical protein
MMKAFLLISFIISSGTNSKILTADDRTALLTGTGTKSWYLYARIPEKANATCKSKHAISSDNTYTFHANGTFEYDHGAVTEDDACEGDDCCSDIVNLTGTWKFTRTGKGLRIIALHEKDNPANDLGVILFDATLEQLDANVLKISQADPNSNTRYTFEFRKR